MRRRLCRTLILPSTSDYEVTIMVGITGGGSFAYKGNQCGREIIAGDQNHLAFRNYRFSTSIHYDGSVGLPSPALC